MIKPMETEEEIRGKAYVHWKSWQESYAGIVDADYLARMTLANCEEKAFCWRDNIFVAKNGGQVVGFVGYGAARGEEGAGEVYALYVLAEYQKRGVGYALMRRALDELSGCRVVYVWVLAENQKAIAFYERVGFRADGEEQEYTLGTPARIIRMTMEMCSAGSVTVVPYNEAYRDEMISMVLEAKAALGRTPKLNEDLLSVKESYLDRGFGFWLALDGERRVVGCVGWHRSDAGEAFLHRLYVKAGRKRQGVGSALLETAESHMRAAGVAAAHVHLGEPREQWFESYAFYPKHGYVEYAPRYMKKEL